MAARGETRATISTTVEERVDFERGIQMAEECYPWLFERFAHDIQQEGADGAERL